MTFYRLFPNAGSQIITEPGSLEDLPCLERDKLSNRRSKDGDFLPESNIYPQKLSAALEPLPRLFRSSLNGGGFPGRAVIWRARRGFRMAVTAPGAGWGTGGPPETVPLSNRTTSCQSARGLQVCNPQPSCKPPHPWPRRESAPRRLETVQGLPVACGRCATEGREFPSAPVWFDARAQHVVIPRAGLIAIRVACWRRRRTLRKHR